MKNKVNPIENWNIFRIENAKSDNTDIVSY